MSHTTTSVKVSLGLAGSRKKSSRKFHCFSTNLIRSKIQNFVKNFDFSSVTRNWNSKKLVLGLLALKVDAHGRVGHLGPWAEVTPQTRQTLFMMDGPGSIMVLSIALLGPSRAMAARAGLDLTSRASASQLMRFAQTFGLILRVLTFQAGTTRSEFVSTMRLAPTLTGTQDVVLVTPTMGTIQSSNCL